MPDPAPRPALDRRDLLVAIAIALVVLGLYSRTLGFDFVGWDDPQYVTANRAVRGGLSWNGVVWAFTTDRMGSWHPLTWLSHMLDVELFGLAPAGHHAVNAVLHAANSVLVFLLLRGLTGALWRSALVAALFGLHPLHVESVAWVAERKDVLSTFFGLLALGAYAAWVRRPALGRYLAVAGLFALSLLCKPMLVTLPFLLLLLDYWPLHRPLRAALLLEKLPLFALSAACSAAALLTQTLATTLPLPQRLANALLSAVAYLGKTLWPARLGMFYPHPYLPESGAAAPAASEVLGAAALLLAVSVCAMAARRRGYLLVGWLWYGISLAPVIGIVQVGSQAMADRYTYFPLLGIFIATSWGAAEIVASLARRRPALPSVAAAAALLWVAALTAASWQQLGYWRDSLALYTHTLEVTPHNATIHFNLANLLRRQGRNAEAIEAYRRALEDAPSDAALHVNLANALRAQGDPEAALRHYRAALERRPEDAMAHLNMASLLREQGQLDEAEAHYRLSMKLSPRAKTAYNLANLLRERGDLDGAIKRYALALKLQPRDARIHNNFGAALEQRGDLDAALRHFQAACALDPRNARAWRNAGRAAKQLGRLPEAVESLRRALELEPDDDATRALLVEVEAQGRGAPVSGKAGSPAP